MKKIEVKVIEKCGKKYIEEIACKKSHTGQYKFGEMVAEEKGLKTYKN